MDLEGEKGSWCQSVLGYGEMYRGKERRQWTYGQSSHSPLSGETRNQLVSIRFPMRNTSPLHENVNVSYANPYPLRQLGMLNIMETYEFDGQRD